jgi:hypothetical protein
VAQFSAQKQPLSPLPPAFDQAPAHFRRDMMKRQFRCALSGNHKNIHPFVQFVTAMTEEFAQAALDSVSHHRVSDFATDGDAKPVFSTVVPTDDDYKMC